MPVGAVRSNARAGEERATLLLPPAPIDLKLTLGPQQLRRHVRERAKGGGVDVGLGVSAAPLQVAGPGAVQHARHPKVAQLGLKLAAVLLAGGQQHVVRLRTHTRYSIVDTMIVQASSTLSACVGTRETV